MDPDLYLRLMDPDSGGPKTCGSGGSGSEFGSGSATLAARLFYRILIFPRICMSIVITELNHLKYEFSKTNFNIFTMKSSDPVSDPDTDRQALDGDGDPIICCASDRLHVF
jgi:hypothetical protein